MATAIQPLDFSVPKAATRNLYHYGLLRTAPVDHITVGGHAFSKETYIPAREKGAQHLRRTGHIVRLTESEKDALIKSVAQRVVRWTKERKDPDGSVRKFGAVYTSTSEMYRPAPGDEPLARYVYMVPTDSDPAQPIPDKALPGDLFSAAKGAKGEKQAEDHGGDVPFGPEIKQNKGR